MTTIGYRVKKRGRPNRTRPFNNTRDDDNNNNNRGVLPLNIAKGDLNAYFNNRFNNPNHNPYAWSGPGPPSSVYTVEKARPNFGPPHKRDWKAYDKFLQDMLG
ncbi:hypothetical protein Pcinc_044277 [Petrolisthes cinctipes]|uniref:Uncharacterized protein n=1 Tax=Petrolisthes cinctipes TaxID=88211 RepID=A0AAE1EFF3_PETCI|nr:hypothetical protein Pcinc_044277 [Petrolisthes cinctipes]